LTDPDQHGGDADRGPRRPHSAAPSPRPQSVGVILLPPPSRPVIRAGSPGAFTTSAATAGLSRKMPGDGPCARRPTPHL